KRIKAVAPDLPVIMLTGHGAMGSAQEALRQGAYDYLSKPCDLDVLATKIHDAFRHAGTPLPAEEKVVEDIMIPVDDYTTVREHQRVKEAISALRETFSPKVSTSRIMETGHRSILVFDDQGAVVGILAITDLLEAIMPGYLSAPKPSTAQSIQYSPMFWGGMFTREVQALSSKTVRDIMSPAPGTIDAAANLMEAAFAMVYEKERRLAAVKNRKVVGIVREQDLFFEIERILR
ncbi:MAG: CBS domain-containing protein, partial [Deltaproteobacteria bacterium]|nr:CBS domain-containing protein [Deltaproteobacteria bacterium]